MILSIFLIKDNLESKRELRSNVKEVYFAKKLSHLQKIHRPGCYPPAKLQFRVSTRRKLREWSNPSCARWMYGDLRADGVSFEQRDPAEILDALGRQSAG